MYAIVDLCILCLTSSETLRSIFSKDNDGTVIEDKCKYLLFEFVDIKPEITNNICLPCLQKLNDACTFKQLCIQNINTIKNYICTLTNLQGMHKPQQFTLNGLKNTAVTHEKENYNNSTNATRKSNSESSEEELRNQRGRKRTNYWKRRAFLSMKSYLDVLPSSDEVQFLELNGLGKSENILKFKRHWSLKRTAEYIQSAFPKIPVNSIGFKYARCNRRKKVELINPKSMEQLESEVRNGVVIILPNEDIRLENPVTFTKNQDCPFYIKSKKVQWQPTTTASHPQQATNVSQTSTTSSTELSAPSASSKVNEVSLNTLPTQQLNKNQFRVILPKITPTETPNIDFEDEILPNEPQIASESDIEPDDVTCRMETNSNTDTDTQPTADYATLLSNRRVGSRRGKKLSKTFKREVFLLNSANNVTFPSSLEQQSLRNNSMGKATLVAEMIRSWNIAQIKSYLLTLYPAHISNFLRQSGFDFVKSNRARKLVKLQDILSAVELEIAIGNGLIIIRPKISFPNELYTPQMENVCETSISEESELVSEC